MQKLLSKLMELPYQQAIQEAKKKLQETYIIINNELIFVYDLNEECIVGHKIYPDSNTEVSFREDQIEQISVFLPECGVYFFEGRPFLLEKRPIRFWKNSFSWQNYRSVSINGMAIESVHAISAVWRDSREEIFVHNNKLYYLGREIGDAKENKIFITDLLYKQEVLDKNRKEKKWLIS